MFLAETHAKLLEDGVLRFQLPGWPRTHYLLSPWSRGFGTFCCKGRNRRAGVAWSVVVLPPRGVYCERNADVAAFVAEIPAAVRRLVRPYQFGQSLLLRSFAALGAAEDLAQSNANLLWLLAFGVYEGRIAADRVEALCATKQAETLHYLIGSGSKAQVRFLRKVRVREGTLTEARVLYDAVSDSAVVHAVRHLPAVPIELLSLLARHASLVHEELAPLIWAKLTECEHAGPERVRTLHRALAGLAAARAVPQPEAFRTALEAAMSELQEPPRIIRDALRVRPPVRLSPPATTPPPDDFPRPPLRGTSSIVPIATREELDAEARDQKNCVAGYAGEVSSGRVYLYRVLAPQRATLEIKLGRDGPRLGQVRLANNRHPNAQTLKAVEDWFEAARADTEDTE